MCLLLLNLGVFDILFLLGGPEGNTTCRRKNHLYFKKSIPQVPKRGVDRAPASGRTGGAARRRTPETLELGRAEEAYEVRMTPRSVGKVKTGDELGALVILDTWFCLSFFFVQLLK